MRCIATQPCSSAVLDAVRESPNWKSARSGGARSDLRLITCAVGAEPAVGTVDHEDPTVGFGVTCEVLTGGPDDEIVVGLLSGFRPKSPSVTVDPN